MAQSRTIIQTLDFLLLLSQVAAYSPSSVQNSRFRKKYNFNRPHDGFEEEVSDIRNIFLPSYFRGTQNSWTQDWLISLSAGKQQTAEKICDKIFEMRLNGPQCGWRCQPSAKAFHGGRGWNPWLWQEGHFFKNPIGTFWNPIAIMAPRYDVSSIQPWECGNRSPIAFLTAWYGGLQQYFQSELCGSS